MIKLNDTVKKLLGSTKTWVVATQGESPNVVPICFKKITGDDELVLFDVFMDTTIVNIKKNGKAAISVYNGETLEGYQIKGDAAYTTDAVLVSEGNSITTKFKLTTKGAITIKVREVIVCTPGSNVGKSI
jgi:predicted pyridoxine 5'-phosphate oxidase superfamily flavin-nucleotide-binding protein